MMAGSSGGSVRRFLHFFFLAVGFLSIAFGSIGFYARWHGGPIGPIPGGALAGTFATAPLDLGRVTEASQLALQVNPAAPRSVTTWVVVVDGRVFVPVAFAAHKVWPHIAVSDPRVVIRVGDQLFERSARRITDPALLRRLRSAVALKYGVGDDADESDEEASENSTWIFELAPPEEAPPVILPPTSMPPVGSAPRDAGD